MSAKRIEGTSASSGIGIGKLFHIKMESRFVYKEKIKSEQIDNEIARFENAIKKSLKSLKKIKHEIEKNRGKGAGIIIETQLLLLNDDELLNSVKEIVKEKKVRTEWAVNLLRLKYKNIFKDYEDNYLKERIIDINDTLNRIIENLKEYPKMKKTLPEDEKIVLFADDLLPSDFASFLTQADIKGIILTKGGINSHTVILARAFEIPTIINTTVKDYEITDGIEVIVDGIEGEILFEPTLSTKKEYLNKKEQFENYLSKLKSIKELPSKTCDGENFKVMANIEIPEEIDMALSYGAEGIGLFRTEFIYLLSSTPPTLKKQQSIYNEVLTKMGDRPVIIRTLDIGAEKKNKLFKTKDEENPTMGLRAIRYFFQKHNFLEKQVTAILRASKNNKVHILFPMVTEIEEIRELNDMVNTLAKKIGIDKNNYKIGAMIEVPSSALLIEHFAKEVDFVSIGTNDLIQYTLAVDRNNPDVNYLYKPLNPAILRLLNYIAKEGAKAGIEVQLCGEMASKPLFAMLLLGLGIKSISMAPIAMPMVKQTLRNTSLKKLKQIIQKTLSFSSASEVEEFLIENFLNKCQESVFENMDII